MIWRRPVRRLGPDRVELRLAGDNAEVISGLVTELRAVLQEDAASDVTRRLFPAAYADDPEHEREYQGLVHDELVAARLRAANAVLAALGRAQGRGGARAVTLSDDEALALLGVLNDIRLSLGVRLEITEELEGRFDPADPRAPELAVMFYLQWIQELILETLPR